MSSSKPRPHLTLHEQARAAFDAKAAALKRQLGPTLMMPTGRPSWMPDVPTTQIDQSKMLGPVGLRSAGPAPYLARVSTGAALGLTGSAASDFEDLCSAMHKAMRPRRVVDHRTVRVVAEEWLFEATTEMTTYCLARINDQLKRYSVAVPIHNLHVQEALRVGDVTFEELSASAIANWHRSPGYDALGDGDKQLVDAFFTRFAKTHQGHAVARVTVWAVKAQAADLALRQVELALGVLRFFSPAAVHPKLRSTCVPFGSEKREEYVAVFESDSAYAGMETGLLDEEAARPWLLTVNDVQAIKRAGLDRAGAMLTKSTPSDFESAVLSSIALYSESTLERRAHVRLLLVLSGLEAIYLANSSEEIISNLRRRLGVATEPDAQERSGLKSLFDSVYHKRSAFVHHGVTLSIDDIPEKFFEAAWSGILFALGKAGLHSRVSDFTAALDIIQPGDATT